MPVTCDGVKTREVLYYEVVGEDQIQEVIITGLMSSQGATRRDFMEQSIE
jgi:hypothetical protein